MVTALLIAATGLAPLIAANIAADKYAAKFHQNN